MKYDVTLFKCPECDIIDTSKDNIIKHILETGHGYCDECEPVKRTFHGLEFDVTPGDPVEAFLNSPWVILDPSKFCPFVAFKSHLGYFETLNGFKRSKHMTEALRAPLDMFGLSVVRDRMEYRGRTLKREYLMGVDLNPDGPH